MPRCMLLHSLAGRMHCDQNACVGCYNNTAGEDIAEDEQCHSVGARCGMLIGQVPVNATGGAIRLWSIFPPVGQWGAGKQQGIGPSTGNEQTAVNRVKPVPCENKWSLYVIICVFWTIVAQLCIYDVWCDTRNESKCFSVGVIEKLHTNIKRTHYQGL